MKGKLILAALLLFCLVDAHGTTGCSRGEPPPPNRQVQGTAPVRTASLDRETSPSSSSSLPLHTSPIAGSWYPSDPNELRNLLNRYLAKAKDVAPGRAKDLTALIVPHAGFVYSGQTAAYAYRVLAQRKPKRILLLGPSHHAAFHGASLGDFRAYETPLGEVRVDPSARALLSDCPLVSFHSRAHEREHSLDIQIPFLKAIFPESTPMIIPLLIGQLNEGDYPVLSRCLEPLLDENTVVIASSDFTHYGPRFRYVPFPLDASVPDNLKQLDDGSMKEILQKDRKGFLAYVDRTGITICGRKPVALLLEMLPKASRPVRLAYETSGNLTGDFQNSVSYYSVAFLNPATGDRKSHEKIGNTRERKAMDTKQDPQEETDPKRASLSEAEKETLLRLARDTVTEYVRNRKRPDPGASYTITDRLQEPRGAFVTLKKGGQLRGCIGYIQPIEPLYKTVQENAVNAATRDSRFNAVNQKELADIEIEISALTVPERVDSADDIVVGTHGIILEKEGRRAVFLPQVAPEQGWDLEETLSHLSRKAGLSKDAWKDPRTTFSVFTAEVFEEKH